MAIGKWGKYTCGSRWVNEGWIPFSGQTFIPIGATDICYASDVTFNSETGEFSATRFISNFGPNNPPSGTADVVQLSQFRRGTVAGDSSHGYVIFYLSHLTGRYKNYFPINFIGYVTATTGTYPSGGNHSDGYWYVYQGLVPPNPPTPLTVPETITGGKETTITWGKATSDGAAISGYELHRSLNNGTFARVYRGAALTYADTVPYGTNTVQYSVRSYDVDNQLSAFTTGVVKNVVNNNPPVITCTDTDKGELEDGFTVHYSVTDEDAADSITVTEAIDGVTLRSFEATRAVNYTADVTALTWLKLLNGEHTLTITAVDNRGGTAVKSIKFTKAVHVIEFTLSTPLACDAAATKAMTQMLAAVPAGALVQVFACNNGFDENPTWVDVTLKVLNNEKIFFANTEKTADKWGYNVRVIIDRNNTTGDCFITSIGGNFE